MLGHDSWGFGLGGGFMWIFWIVLIILVVWLAKTGFGSNPGSRSSGTDSPSALEILKQRYARGEINQEEYETKRKHLLE